MGGLRGLRLIIAVNEAARREWQQAWQMTQLWQLGAAVCALAGAESRMPPWIEVFPPDEAEAARESAEDIRSGLMALLREEGNDGRGL